LNRKGERAYVTCSEVNPKFNTPTLTKTIVSEINSNQINPIVVYPETVFGNPLGGAAVVRYLLSFPGLLGGNKELNSNEMIVSWVAGLNYLSKENEFVLHLPVVDDETFCPPPKDSRRSGSCFYWRKYKYIFNGKLEHQFPDSIEISGVGPSAPTQQEIADLFRRSEVFYCYENTALMLEAGLCGCPTILIPNEYFNPNSFLGTNNYGIAWSDEPDALTRAIQTLDMVRQNHLDIKKAADNKIEKFIQKSQEFARSYPFYPIRFYRSYEMPTKRKEKFLLLISVVLSGEWKRFIKYLKFILKKDTGRLKSEIKEAYFLMRAHLETD
jgi:hypothetical protein